MTSPDTFHLEPGDGSPAGFMPVGAVLTWMKAEPRCVEVSDQSLFNWSNVSKRDGRVGMPEGVDGCWLKHADGRLRYHAERVWAWITSNKKHLLARGAKGGKRDGAGRKPSSDRPADLSAPDLVVNDSIVGGAAGDAFSVSAATHGNVQPREGRPVSQPKNAEPSIVDVLTAQAVAEKIKGLEETARLLESSMGVAIALLPEQLGGMSAAEASRRKQIAEARLAHIKALEAEGRLVEQEVVTQAVKELCTAVKTRLESMVVKSARDISAAMGLDSERQDEVTRMLQAAVLTCLSEMSAAPLIVPPAIKAVA